MAYGDDPYSLGVYGVENMDVSMTKQDVEKLLGRSLSSKENAAFEEYIDIAKTELEELLNIRLDRGTEERIFDSRDGYRTLFTDPFTVLTSIKIDDDTVDAAEYRKAWNDRRTNTWYNSVIFDCEMADDEEVAITATWGFGEKLPNDLSLLWARMFVVISSTEVSGSDRVRSKSIEDFSVTYDTSKQPKEQFLTDNARVIAKYKRPDAMTMHGGC